MLHCHSHCDLDLYPIDPKIDREHLLSITNICMKFEKAGPNQTLVIDGDKVVYAGQTGAKQYTPLLRSGA